MRFNPDAMAMHRLLTDTTTRFYGAVAGADEGAETWARGVLEFDGLRVEMVLRVGPRPVPDDESDSA